MSNTPQHVVPVPLPIPDDLKIGTKWPVLCVKGEWNGYKNIWWPVIGPLHEDHEIIGFNDYHFHLDLRFISKRNFSIAASSAGNRTITTPPSSARFLYGRPLMLSPGNTRFTPDGETAAWVCVGR